MNKALLVKKSVGTSLITVVILAFALIVSGQARALITFITNDLDFTGTVTQVSPTSFEVDKGGTFPFTVVTNSETDFDGSYAQLSDVEIGDNVSVSATEDQGMLLALNVEPIVGGAYGYGAGCELFQAEDLYVSGIQDGRVYMSRANITFQVDYNASTEVLPGDQSVNDLEIGELVTVIGDDCNSDGLLASQIIRGVLPPTGNIACDNYTGYGFNNTQYLLSHDEGGAFTPRFATDVPAGTYDVYGVSFDDHSQNAWDTFTNERWYIEAFSDGTLDYTSGVTDDLPDGIDRNATMIGANVTVGDLDELRFIHNAYVDPAYQSILPECVVFVPTSDTAAVEVTQL